MNSKTALETSDFQQPNQSTARRYSTARHGDTEIKGSKLKALQAMHENNSNSIATSARSSCSGGNSIGRPEAEKHQTPLPAKTGGGRRMLPNCETGLFSPSRRNVFAPHIEPWVSVKQLGPNQQDKLILTKEWIIWNLNKSEGSTSASECPSRAVFPQPAQCFPPSYQNLKSISKSVLGNELSQPRAEQVHQLRRI